MRSEEKERLMILQQNLDVILTRLDNYRISQQTDSINIDTKPHIFGDSITYMDTFKSGWSSWKTERT